MSGLLKDSTSVALAQRVTRVFISNAITERAVLMRLDWMHAYKMF